MPADRREPGLPLSYYLSDHPDAGLLVICDRCQRGNRYEIPAVVRHLTSRGIEQPAEIGIRLVAEHVRSPCKQCGGTSYSSRPDWPLHRLPHQPV